VKLGRPDPLLFSDGLPPQEAQSSIHGGGDASLYRENVVSQDYPDNRGVEKHVCSMGQDLSRGIHDTLNNF
jgi:hypothetical protein